VCTFFSSQKKGGKNLDQTEKKKEKKGINPYFYGQGKVKKKESCNGKNKKSQLLNPLKEKGKGGTQVFEISRENSLNPPCGEDQFSLSAPPKKKGRGGNRTSRKPDKREVPFGSGWEKKRKKGGCRSFARGKQTRGGEAFSHPGGRGKKKDSLPPRGPGGSKRCVGGGKKIPDP